MKPQCTVFAIAIVVGVVELPTVSAVCPDRGYDASIAELLSVQANWLRRQDLMQWQLHCEDPLEAVMNMLPRCWLLCH